MRGPTAGLAPGDAIHLPLFPFEVNGAAPVGDANLRFVQETRVAGAFAIYGRSRRMAAISRGFRRP